jgi:hypothetical protein
MEFLNQHVEQAFIPRIGHKQSKLAIARAALKHIPGSEQIIQKTFQTKPVPLELPIVKPIDQVMHTGFQRH